MNLALLPIAEIESRLAAANDAMDRLCDYAAEIRSEIAMFGDSGPGTAKILAGYEEANRDVIKYSIALSHARQIGPFLPEILKLKEEEECPF